MVRPNQPVIRFPGLRTGYTRPEVGGLLMGCYEPGSRAYDPWAFGPKFTMRDVARETDVFLAHVEKLIPWMPFIEEAPIIISQDDARQGPMGYQVAHVLGFGIAGTIFANTLVFMYFAWFYASG